MKFKITQMVKSIDNVGSGFYRTKTHLTFKITVTIH